MDETTLLDEDVIGKPRIMNYWTMEKGGSLEKIELTKEKIIVDRAGKALIL